MKSWKDISRKGNAYALNHTSFWDVFMLIQIMPLSYLLETRTLMKASLRDIPIFGGCFDRVGHFPVFFKSDEDGNFQVDKERQAAVQVHVNQHIENGGNLAIFPEGAVNKNTAVLKPFRFGTFATIFEHKMPLYYVVSVGNEKTWPPQCVSGGFPADIRVRCGVYPIDFATQDSKQVASEMQAFMQKVHAEMVEELENEKAPKGSPAAPQPVPQLATA
ncbi:acyltransferase, copy 2 [Angomonas deanei]|nr:acyltransferase, copy 2 [Angomonas deanei]|eukprot:EPY30475.1 acyltransferase, copy 2 [Angomonas deanei]